MAALSLQNCANNLFNITGFFKGTKYVVTHSKANVVPSKVPGPARCCTQTVVRRSGNYKPSIWHDDYLQSLSNPYTGEIYTSRAENLIGHVRKLLREVAPPLEQLELVDTLQRLGISYHFQDEIQFILETTYNNMNDMGSCGRSLYHTTLEFRLLRQHGFYVPPEIFDGFRDDNGLGNFKELLSKDTEGLLSLYEATFLSMENKTILEEAKDFTIKHLSQNLKQETDQCLAKQVEHALEMPFQWRMKRLETKWFLDIYEKKRSCNLMLLELGNLDFNTVQAEHQEDLKHTSSWWRQTGLGDKLSFSRDRIVENFFWTVGMLFEPQYGECRRMVTKINSLVTTIDDVYDVYGTFEELEAFTAAVDRWEINEIDQLPDYMKLCFLALFNTSNEIAYHVLREHDLSTIGYLKKAWADLCKSYLVEAKWYHTGYKPTLDEYIENAWVSISAPLALTNAYFLTTNHIHKGALDSLKDSPNLFRYSGIIVRLADDLGTSSDELKRGDVPKSIQCYMNETGASEEDARKFIGGLIDDTWKKMNEEQFLDSPFLTTFKDAAMNLGRTAQCMYQHGDGYGVQDVETKDRVLALLMKPVSM